MTQVTIEQAIQIALGHHQAGRLAEAEGIYRQVLAEVPDHPDALHLRGVLACQSGHPEAAIELIGRAIAINPSVAEYHSNLGESYLRAGQWEGAITSFRRAIELKPSLANAHSNLGNALWKNGRLDEAIVALRRAIALEPDLAEAHNNLGLALHDNGRLDEAIAAYHRAIALRPDLAEAHNNLGTALKDQGRTDEAIAVLGRAIALEPDDAAAHSNLGTALNDQGRLDEAIAAHRHAIALRPGLAEAHNNLGNALKDHGRLDEAIAACSHAIELRPDLAEAHVNLGNALADKGRLDEAVASYDRAIARKPSSAEAQINLGDVFLDQGRLDQAIACFRRAVALKPDFSRAAGNLTFTLPYHPAYDAQVILAEQRHWATRFAEPLAAQIRAHTNNRTPDRQLRIGFLSPDLRDHPVGRLLLPLFSHHDRRQTEFVGYSDVRRPDAITEKLKALADHWHDTMGLSDPQVADRIRADRIDILVDTTLHAANNRLLVFARKPAPVQIVMLGLPITTGLSTVDYRLTDRFLDPPRQGDADYTEQSIRLPHVFWCYQPPEEAPPVAELPALRNGFVTFGCLNRFAKVTQPALQLWIRILQSLPGSRLVIQAQAGSHLNAVRTLFQAGGIALDRVKFAAAVSFREYLHRYHDLDLSLDPFPHNGHASTLDSLWMGVPVVTLAGRTVVGRAGVSLLSNVGLPELSAETPQEYVDIAVQCARDLSRLSALRAGLRQQMQSSALMDVQQFTADVEAVFRRVWQSWCNQ